jgi:YegS/Rv2252/BmrU family lipid kinase
MGSRLLILLNPAARGGRNRTVRPALEAALRDAALDARVVETTGAGDAERLAREATAEVVVSAGGDGTVHEVVNGLADGDAVLGVLPLGTGNDFAHALGMPDGLAASVAALAAARPVPIDLGHVRWEEADGAVYERRFANCLGMGFDAHAAHLAGETKWIGGRAAYLAAVLRTLWAWRRPPVLARVALAPALATSGAEAAAPEVVLDGPLFLCEVGNGHSVGGGFLLTPDARVDDGLLDVCLVRHVAPRRALRLLPRTFTGAHVGEPEVHMDRTRGLEVEARSGALALQADGETVTFGARRVAVRVLPGAVRALAPGLDH